MSDVDKKLAEIRERHELGERWRYGPSLICPKSHEDRAFLLNEITRLRARVEVLREPLAVYVHAHQTGNSVPPHIEAAARAALKEAKP
jgi:hypothetical protein